MMPANKNLNSNEWQVAPKFLLRMTGFEVELIGKLQFTLTAANIRQLLSLDSTKLPGFQVPVDKMPAAFQNEVVEKTGHLQTISSKAKFLEALFLSNPSNYYLIEKWTQGKTRKPGKIRQGLLSVITYLQRFCMKNDTTSFFGPTFWGTFDFNGDRNLTFSYNGLPKVKRTFFFTHWCANAVARWIQKLPGVEQIIQPRRVPTMTLLKNRVYGVIPAAKKWEKVDKLTDLPDHAEDIFRLIDGQRTLNDLFKEAKSRFGLSEKNTRTVVNRLVSERLIFADIEIPVGLYQPMNYIQELIKNSGLAEAQRVVSTFQTYKQEFVSSDLNKRKELFVDMGDYFKQITGLEPTRGQGEHYADRTIFYEEGTRNFHEFIISGKLLKDITALGPIWDLLCIPVEHEYKLLQETMVQRFRKWFPNQSSVPLVQYVHAFLDDTGFLYKRFDDISEEIQKISQNIFNRLVLPDELTKAVIPRTMAEIVSINKRYQLPGASGVVINPDILIAASDKDAVNSGDYQVVIGDVHASVDLITHSPAAFFLADADKEMLRSFVTDRYRESINEDEWAADLVRVHMRKTSAQLTLKGIDIEGIGRSSKNRDAVVLLADLEVRLHQGRLRLYSPHWKKYIRLTNMRLPNNCQKETSPLRLFSLPEQEGGLKPPLHMSYCPRIEVGNITLLRRTWRMNYHDWSYQFTPTHKHWDFNLFVHMLKMQDYYKLPGYVFARIEDEPKPIFVDFDNYFLLHAFYRKWQKHKKSVTITEAYPRVEKAWLSDEKGHYFCELRMGWYRKSKKHMEIESCQK
ncbi:MAG: lantibiotic dehydratase [Candidatus Aminicenantes bacterium]|nr:MAG: lantibiotic dehydratase [Candidatus Aminicenantes bacterium]